MPFDRSLLPTAKNTFAYACGCMACTGKSPLAASGGEAVISHSGFDAAQLVNASLVPGAIMTIPDATFTANVGANGFDNYGFNLVAGVTYTFAMRGIGADPIVDPLIFVAGPQSAGFPLIEYDDDGGAGITAMYTLTPDVSGLYLIQASSFSRAAGDPAFEIGDYRLDVWVAGADEVPDTLAGAVSIGLGTTYGHIETSGDIDTYKISVVAGQSYTVELAGGVDYRTDYLAVPEGELDTIVAVYDENGNLVTFNDDVGFPSDISSLLAFTATSTGTYYIDVLAYPGQTGGYTLDVAEIDFSAFDPVDAIRWESANNVQFPNGVAKVYFGDSDVNFGQFADDGGPMITIDWNAYEKQQIMLALEEYEKILGVDYQVTTDANEATFRLLKTESEQYGAYFFPQDPGFGSDQGVGVFNVLSGGWSFDQQQSLVRGGFSFAVVLHEFGHAHGLAHPHDNGGGSDIMLGVRGTSSLGFFNLNQGVYTVMSYNDAWQTHPDGPSPYNAAGVDNGWSGSLSAFDIKALQDRYGEHPLAGGNTVYQLKDANDQGTFYQTIWDTGGVDEIRYSGARDAQIDLLAATLDYSPTGGGVVSFVDGIWGGYTIANGVTIENATGGSGHDVLLGNGANNVLTGNGGNDVLVGRGGNDVHNGGGGIDTYVFDGLGTVETINGYQKGEKIDLTALGLGGSEVTITKKGIFVDADENGSIDLTIWVNGPQVQPVDVILI